MRSTKPDIQTSSEVKQMVDSFYEQVNLDPLLSPVFNDFANVDWESHLPRMYSFWESVLFAKQGFKGRPFQKHIPLPIKAEHFDRWVTLFVNNIDHQFEGPVAEEAKLRARSIAHIFQTKLKHLNRLQT
ncbi:MAG: group III truncated hemoglobin [Bacteroidia bacterium]|nr:group III truncated hemoglobin [Bacteroidia bacterium]